MISKKISTAIWIFAALGLSLVSWRLVYLDDQARHKRLWAEFRLIATLTERSRLDSALALHQQALDEAKALGGQNAMYAMTLKDIGVVTYKLEKYRQAVSILDQAISTESNLLAAGTPDCDRRMLQDDIANTESLKAECFKKLGDNSEKMSAYLQTIVKSSTRLSEPPIELSICDALSTAFINYSNGAQSAAEFSQLLSTLPPSIARLLPAENKADLSAAFLSNLDRARIEPADRRLLSERLKVLIK